MMKPSRNSSSGILDRLKICTADVHHRVEEQLQIFAPEFNLSAYTQLLAKFYGFWAPLEAQLRKVPELRHPALALETRLKSDLLEADLRVFGVDPVLAPVCSDLPAVSTLPGGLGCLYVLEGSTLGSKIISRHIRARFRIDAGSGASFFNAYGPAVGERWSEFRQFVSSNAEAGHEGEMLMAARTTFESLHRWLAAAQTGPCG